MYALFAPQKGQFAGGSSPMYGSPHISHLHNLVIFFSYFFFFLTFFFGFGLQHPQGIYITTQM